MDIPSSNDHVIDVSHLTNVREGLPLNNDTPTELLFYFENIIVFLQHFNEHTPVHEIKTLLASFEQKANYQFCFLFHQSSKRVRLPSNTHSHFSLQFRKLIYGTLCVRKQAHQPDEPAFPLKLAHHLSHLCGWLLYTLEQSVFISSYQQPEFSTNDTLSKREREVLTLMCQGYKLEDIAQTLNIMPATVTKHKQNIYSQLGVHNMRDALHVAYHCGLVSFLDELYQ